MTPEYTVYISSLEFDAVVDKDDIIGAVFSTGVSELTEFSVFFAGVCAFISQTV